MSAKLFSGNRSGNSVEAAEMDEMWVLSGRSAAALVMACH
jgi:hypothetical protein